MSNDSRRWPRVLVSLRRSRSELVSRELPGLVSGDLCAQPHAERADDLRYGLKARIALWRKRLIKASPGDAGFLR